MPSAQTKKIVILGGGFGGVHTFLRLQKLLRYRKDITITLVSNNNYFLFTPFLHEVATAGMQAEDIIEPLSNLVSHSQAEVVEASVQNISLKKKIVTTSTGDIPFDSLVVALGSTNNFYGIQGVEQHCFTLKNIPDAIKIKNHFIDLAKNIKFLHTTKEKETALRITIIGAGATGVELAAETSDLFQKTLSHYFPKSHLKNHLEILLIEQAPKILPGFSEKIKQKTLKILKKKGITVMCNTAVKKVSTRGSISPGAEKLEIHTQNEVINTSTTIWTAGIKPTPVDFDTHSYDEKGCLLVGSTLELYGAKNVFVIGDIALCLDNKTKKPVPHLAQSALQQAEMAAQNIADSVQGKSLHNFSYQSLGQFISLGDNIALGEISRFSFSGRPGSWLWHIIHLSKMLSWKKRIQVALNWFLRSCGRRDISKF